MRKFLGVGQFGNRTDDGILRVFETADDGQVLERAVVDEGQQVGRMGSGYDLDVVLRSLLFDQFEQKPLPRRMNAGVNLLEEIQARLNFSPSSTASMARKRSVPSEAL